MFTNKTEVNKAASENINLAVVGLCMYIPVNQFVCFSVELEIELKSKISRGRKAKRC